MVDIITKIRERFSENYQESFASRIVADKKRIDALILTSSNDDGVANNGGRIGARYAPEAILNSLKKLTCHQDLTIKIEELNEVTEIAPKGSLVHLGGGHDHLYTLGKKLLDQGKTLTIINIDPHLDTRADSWSHSGTPLRELANYGKKRVAIFEVGTAPFSNLRANYEGMGTLCQKFEITEIIDLPDPKKLAKSIIKKIPKGSVVILSLDTDALDSSLMEGVSAVAHLGISKEWILEFLKHFFTLKNDQILFGIYEYNPLYDNLSQKGSRFLAALIYLYLTRKK